MKHTSIIRRNRRLSLLFGMTLGFLFPAYAALFVTFKSPVMFVIFLAGCVGAGFTVGIVSFLINMRTVRKMAVCVSEAIDKVSRGEPDALAEVHLESDDELGEMVKSFRKGLEYFQRASVIVNDNAGTGSDLRSRVDSSLRGIRESLTGLRGALEGAEVSAIDLDGRNRELQREFEVLNKATLLSVSHVVELYSSVTGFGDAVIDQIENLRTVEDSLVTIERTVGTARDVRGTENLAVVSGLIEERVARTVETAETVFKGISESLESIGALAERTNVLSINAAIESARLGKEGMGFRIISGNIRQLADEVNTITGKIKKVLESGDLDIRGATGELSAAVGSQRSMVEGLRSSVEMLRNVDIGVSDKNNRIQNYRGEIGDLLKDIRDNMQKLKEHVGATRKGFDSIIASATKVHADIANLRSKAEVIERNDREAGAAFGEYQNHMRDFNANRS